MRLRDATSMTDQVKHSQNLQLLNAFIQNLLPIGTAVLQFPDIFQGSTPAYWRMAQSPNRGNVVLLTDSTTTLLLCGGVTADMIQVPSIANSIVSPSVESVQRESLDAQRRGEQEIADYLGEVILRRAAAGVGLTCIGYSWGGAMAAGVFSRYRAAHGQRFCECYTYGAPRFFGPGFNAAFRDQYYVRVFNSHDPVVSFPPHLDEQTNFLGLQSRGVIGTCGRFVHNRDGFSQDTDGILTLRESSVPDPWDASINFARWLAGTSGFLNNEHSFGEYLRRANIASLAVQPQPPAEAPPVAEPRPDTSPRAIDAAQVAARRNAIVIDSGDIDASARAIIGRITPVRGEKFKGRKFAGYRVVVYGGEIMAWCDNRRRQRALVRQLNRDLANAA